MPLTALPVEIHIPIARNLDRIRDISSWAATSRYFYSALLSELHSTAAKYDKAETGWPMCLTLAAVSGQLMPFKELLDRTEFSMINKANIKFSMVSSTGDPINAVVIPRPSEHHTTLLCALCALGEKEMVELLLAKLSGDTTWSRAPSYLDLLDNMCHSAMDYAIASNYLVILKLLLEAGANPTFFRPPIYFGPRTPLNNAAERRNLSAIDLLLEFGANPLDQGVDGEAQAPLISACDTATPAIPEKMLDAPLALRLQL